MYIYGQEGWKMVVPEYEGADTLQFYRTWTKDDTTYEELYLIHSIQKSLGTLIKTVAVRKNQQKPLTSTQKERNGTVDDLMILIAKESSAIREILNREETQRVIEDKGYNLYFLKKMFRG